MVKKYSENNSRNARIKIDYRTKNPKVNFSYPNIKDYTEGSVSFLAVQLWCIVVCIIITFFFISQPFIVYSQSIMNYEYYDIDYKTNFNYTTIEFIKGITKGVIVFFLIFGIPIIFSILFNKYGKKCYPKIMKSISMLFGTHYEIVLNKKNLRIEKDKIYLEIPLFHNVFLEYVAKDDFKKYLDYFQIKEYNLKGIKRFDGKKEVKSSDVFWYARFYFSKEPKNGEIKIKFI